MNYYRRSYGRVAKTRDIGLDPKDPDYTINIPEPPRDRSDIYNFRKKTRDQKWEWEDKEAKFESLPEAEKTEWLLEEIRRRKEGFWFFNNGVATWITGHHYFYLQYMIMEGGIRPNYRDRDTKFFYVWDLCEKDPNCQGLVYAKMRREGATTKAASIIINTMTMVRNCNAGIQSQTMADASKFFDRVVDAYFDLPQYFRPQTSGSTRPKTKLEMFEPSQMITYKNKDHVNQKKNRALKNTIDYRSTDKSSYDGHKMKIYIHDEAGKIKVPNNIIKTWAVVGPAMMEGKNILGKALIPSTVGEMSKDGGVQFQNLYLASNIKDAEAGTNWRTGSHLYRLFLPADEGYGGFIGEYGESISGPPTKSQLAWLRKKDPKAEEGIGARQYILNSRKNITEDLLDERIRQFPLNEAELFRWAEKDSPFNIKKVIDQKSFILENPKKLPSQRYRLEWENGVKFSKVIAKPDSNGRYKIRWMPPSEWLNKVDSRRKPQNAHRFAAGVDPFGIDVVKGKGSNCSVEIYMYPNEDVDDYAAGDEIGWVSDNFVASYTYRAQTTSLMNEDILKFLWFFGCPALIERNKTVTINFFKNDRLGGFSLDRPENTKSEYNKKRAEDKGIHSDKKVIEQYTVTLAEHFENNWRRYWDYEGLEDMEGFDPSKTTDSDQTVAKGLALLAANRRKPKRVNLPGDKKLNFFRIFDKSA